MVRMSSDETISQMFVRCNTITNDLINTLGKTYISIELVNEILEAYLKLTKEM